MRVARWLTWTVCTAGLAACSAQAPAPDDVPGNTPGSETATPAVDRVERGAYLVTAMACEDCHTPLAVGPTGAEPDVTRRLSGHPQGIAVEAVPVPEGFLMLQSETGTAFVGPWGVSYAANLTSDPHTGIGMYTDQMFIDAMRHGRHMGSERPLLPPMPWTSIGHLTDADLVAILAYLKTVPAISNAVGAHSH